MTSVLTVNRPRSRTLIHPGPPCPVRIQSLRSQSAAHIRLRLEPGRTLFDALVAPLADRGITSASTTILGGSFTNFEYCVAPPDPSGQAVIAYTAPIQVGGAFLIFGNATVGWSLAERPLVHCHAAFLTEDGRVKGGHVITERSVVGADPITVLVTSLDAFRLSQCFDPETNIPLLQPQGEPGP